MKHRYKIAIILVPLAILWITFSPMLASRLVVERKLAKADVIMVLSGSAAYKQRTRKAAELYIAGVAPQVLITDDGERAGWSTIDQRNPPFVELERRELIANGVLPDAIKILPGKVTGTDMEAKALAKDMEEQPIMSVVVVTSPYHTRRALWTFEKFLDGKGVVIGMEQALHDDHYPKPATWWMTKTGWQLVGGEYVKSVAYWLFN